MMNLVRPLFLLSLLFSLLLAGVQSGMAAVPKKTPAKAKMPDFGVIKEEGPVDIEADLLSYDREEHLYQAHGNVEITKGNLSLTAEHARLSADTNEMVAWGNVVLREGEDVLECERLEINLNTRRGRVFQGKLFLKDQNFHITGQEAEKLGESTYRIRQGSFTTCDASRPPWSFTVRELDLDTAGVGIAKEPVFYVEDVPIFYLPALPIPVKRERQTGFLLPVPGYSSLYGPRLRTAFYWNISKDMDSTLFLDYLGDRGFKEGIEYRYAFPRETTGSAKFYFINDKVYGAKRESFFLQHEQKLPDDFYLKGDINWVSDRYYPADFPRDLTDKSRIDASSLNELRSVVFGGKNWEKFSLLVDAEHFDNLTLNHNDETLQKYPQAGFYAYPQALLKTPFFFDGALSYVNFWRKQGTRAQRADLLPQVSYPMRLFDFLKVTPNVALRETVYQTYDDPEGNNGTRSRFLAEGGAVASTELYRVFETSSNSKLYNLLAITRWMHTLEPSVGYNYVPRVSQGRLPSFDQTDRIPYLNEITYGFTTRLLGKSGKDKVGTGPYEYVRLRIFQGYSLGGAYEQDVSGQGRNFSNIRGQLWMNFDPNLTLRGNAEFNPYRGSFDVLDALVKVKDLRDDALQVEYRYTRDNIHQLNLYAKVKTISSIFLYGGIRYNLLDKWWVEMDYGAVFQTQCWSLGVLFENINQTPNGNQQKEFKVEVYVTLLGVGSLGHIPRMMTL